jgi:hypothetical protein
MSWPRHAKRGDVPPAVPPPAPAATPPPPDDERVYGGKRPLHAVPDPLPSPEPEEPPTAEEYARLTCKLTPFQLSLATPGDPDFLPGEADTDQLLEPGFFRWLEFDKAVDREPEIE